MMEFLHVRRWEKRNRTDFYWVILLAGIQFDNLKVLKQFVTENYAWRHDSIV